MIRGSECSTVRKKTFNDALPEGYSTDAGKKLQAGIAFLGARPVDSRAATEPLLCGFDATSTRLILRREACVGCAGLLLLEIIQHGALQLVWVT
jgi:hypothetical protein